MGGWVGVCDVIRNRSACVAISALEEVERGRGREGLVAMLQTHTIPPQLSPFPFPLSILPPSSVLRVPGRNKEVGEREKKKVGETSSLHRATAHDSELHLGEGFTVTMRPRSGPVSVLTVTRVGQQQQHKIK